MRFIRTIQAFFIVVLSMIYLPFLTRKKVSLIKEDISVPLKWDELNN